MVLMESIPDEAVVVSVSINSHLLAEFNKWLEARNVSGDFDDRLSRSAAIRKGMRLVMGEGE